MTKPVTAQEIKQKLGKDIDALLEEVAKALNEAKPGHIIADSEESVHDAVGVFRQRLYQMAVEIRQNNEEGAFSPSAPGDLAPIAQQGQPQDNSPDGKRPAGDNAQGVLEQTKRKRRAGG